MALLPPSGRGPGLVAGAVRRSGPPVSRDLLPPSRRCSSPACGPRAIRRAPRGPPRSPTTRTSTCSRRACSRPVNLSIGSLPLNRCAPFFDNQYNIVNNGRWFGMYFIGHGAVLAPGSRHRARTVDRRHRSGPRPSPWPSGLPAGCTEGGWLRSPAGSWCLSPFFIFVSATHLSQPTSSLFLALFVYSCRAHPGGGAGGPVVALVAAAPAHARPRSCAPRPPRCRRPAIPGPACRSARPAPGRRQPRWPPLGAGLLGASASGPPPPLSRSTMP